MTVLPATRVAPLREHLARLFARFERQRRLGEQGVPLPTRLHQHEKVLQRAVQELLGHADVRTTMIYTHVLGKGPWE